MKQPLFYTLLAAPISDSSVAPSRSIIVPTPGQPTYKGDPGKFEIVGNSLVSAQQVRDGMFLVSPFF